MSGEHIRAQRPSRGSSLLDSAELAQGASISLIGKVAGRSLHLLAQVIIGRLFGPAYYGQYAIGLTILRLAGLMSVFGMDTAMVRYGANHYPDHPRRLRAVLILGIGVPLAAGTAVGGGILAAAGWLAAAVFKDPSLAPIIRWFALGIGPIAGLHAGAAATRISKRMQYSMLSEELAQPALALMGILVAYVLGFGILGAAAATVVSVIAGLMLALYFINRLFAEAILRAPGHARLWRELILYSISISGTRVIVLLMTWVDRLLLGAFRPAAEVGIYQAAAQSSVIFAIILGAFNSIFSPIVAKLWHRNERSQMESAYRISTKWGLYLSLPLYVVLVSAPAELLAVVFGAEFAGGALALIILATGQLINASTGAVGVLLSITGHQRRWAIDAAAALAIDLVLIFALVPRYGMLGAAAATAGTLSGLFIIGLVQVRRVLALWPYDRRYFKGLLGALLSASLVYPIGRLMLPDSLLGLAGLTMVSFGTFVLALLALGLDAEDREFLALIRSRASRRRTAGND